MLKGYITAHLVSQDPKRDMIFTNKHHLFLPANQRMGLTNLANIVDLLSHRADDAPKWEAIASSYVIGRRCNVHQTSGTGVP